MAKDDATRMFHPFNICFCFWTLFFSFFLKADNHDDYEIQTFAEIKTS